MVFINIILIISPWQEFTQDSLINQKRAFEKKMTSGSLSSG